jgi:hypothetical protein
MKRSVATLSLAVVLVLALAAPSDAWWRGGFWWGPPFWFYPRPYVVVPAPIVVPAPVVVPPPAYVRPVPAQGYWYYCASAKAYYPSVGSCPEEWVKVRPR